MKKEKRPGWMYILRCSNGNYYTGSTVDLWRRMKEHWTGKGANYTRKHPPVNLMYCEYFEDVRLAFYREKQIQGWSHKKKKALIQHDLRTLKWLAQCKNKSHCSRIAKEMGL